MEDSESLTHPDVELEASDDDMDVEFLSDEDLSSVCVSLDDMVTTATLGQGTTSLNKTQALAFLLS